MKIVSIGRKTVTFDSEDEQLLDKQLSSKNYDTYSDAIKAAVRKAFGAKEK